MKPRPFWQRWADWFAVKPKTRIPITLALLIILWLGACLYIYYMAAGPIAAGTNIQGVNVGGMSPDQAARKIDNEFNRNRVLNLTADGETWQVNPMEFGLWVDPNATAQQAYLYGRGDEHWQQLARMLTGQPGPTLEPVVVFSESKAKDQLAAISGIVYQLPGDPSFVFDAGAWTLIAGEPGRSMDLNATLAKLKTNPTQVISQGRMELVTVPIYADLKPYQDQLPVIEGLLMKPLQVQAYDPITDTRQTWDVPRELLGSWLRLSYTEGLLEVRVDEAGFGPFLTQLERELPDDKTFILPPIAYNLTDRWRAGTPYIVTLHYPPTEYVIAPGDTLLRISYRQQMPAWMILKANPSVNADVLPIGTTLTIPSRNDLLPLPIVMGKRIKLSISEQRMWVYENGEQIREFVISTGINRSPTQPGVFQTQLYDPDAYASVWDLRMPNFIGIYQSWEGFWNGTHGLPTLSGGRLLWEGNLGHPVSYGCIILKLDEAEWLYSWAPLGTVVEIVE